MTEMEHYNYSGCKNCRIMGVDMASGTIGTCNGKINIGSGKIGTGTCTPCSSGGGGTPCTGTLPSSISIVGYSSSLFTSCAGYYPTVAGDCAWTGIFDYLYHCAYSNRACFAGNGCFDCSIGPMRMWEYQPPGISAVGTAAGMVANGLSGYSWVNGNQYCAIAIQNGADSGEWLWIGSASYAGTFATTYTRVGGCSPTPASLTLG